MATTVVTITHGDESEQSIQDELSLDDTTPQEGSQALLNLIGGIKSGARQGKLAVVVGADSATWKFGVG
jgi:hypothetical protein